jgi:5-methylcytosine-specific restriction endonuclease McrA
MRTRATKPKTHRVILAPAVYAAFKLTLALRAGGRCEHCRSSRGPFDVEHAVPRSRGGGDTIENCWFACRRCNERKHWAYDRGRLLVEPIVGAPGRFVFTLVWAKDKWAARMETSA